MPKEFKHPADDQESETEGQTAELKSLYSEIPSLEADVQKLLDPSLTLSQRFALADELNHKYRQKYRHTWKGIDYNIHFENDQCEIHLLNLENVVHFSIEDKGSGSPTQSSRKNMRAVFDERNKGLNFNI